MLDFYSSYTVSFEAHVCIIINIHTYIHILLVITTLQSELRPSFSHHLCYVNRFFIHNWRDLQFKVDFERQIFEKLFHGNFIYSQSFCQKSAERKLQKKYISVNRFRYLTRGLNRGLTSINPTRNLLLYGDHMVW